MAQNIAQAVAQIRPDLTGFARSLREQLKAQIGLVGVEARSITVNVKLASGSKTALQAELNRIKGLTVEVTPILAQGAKTRLATQLGTVPIQVSLAKGRANEIGQAIAASTASSQVGVTAAAGATPGTAGLASAQASVLRATEAQAKAQANLTRIEADAAATTNDLTAARLRLSTADATLEASTQRLSVAQSKLDAERAAATAASPAALQEQQRLQALEASAAAEKLAAENATIAAAARSASSQASIAAQKAVTNASISSAKAQDIEKRAAVATTEVKQRLAVINEQLAVAEKTENAETIRAIGLDQAQTSALLAQVEAARLLAQVNVRRDVAQGIGDPATIREAGLARVEQQKLLIELNKAEAAALEANNVALRQNIIATRGYVEAQIQRIAVVESEITVENERAAVVARNELARRQLAASVNPEIALVSQKARLLALENSLTEAIARFTIANTGATTSQIESLAATRADVIATREQIVAKIAASEAIAAQTVTQSQALRGATATGAGFLGLRGAVLSASSGFLAATIAVTAFAKTIQTAANLQQSLNVFQSVAEATGDEMDAAAASARELGADLTLPATSANDAAQAMTELARAGLSVQDSLDGARGVLQLAAAANISVGDAATIVATELNAFELAGVQATRVADLLAGAAKSAQGEITDFALAFQQVATIANQVELPIETTTAILTQFAKAGLRGSDAGTSLRTMLLRLVPTTKSASEEMAKLGIELDEQVPIGAQFLDLVDQYTAALAKLGPVAQQESLTKIFGQDAIRGATIALTDGHQALVQIEKDITKPGIAAEQAAARMKGFSGSIEGLKSEIETFAGTLGSTLLPALTGVAQDLSIIVKTADEAVNAIKQLGDIGIGGVTAGNIAKQITTPLAGIGLVVGAGVGFNKIREALRDRKAQKLAAVEAAEAETAAAAAAVTRDNIVQSSAIKTAGVQTAASAEAATAARVASAAGASAWESAGAVIIRGTRLQSGAQIVAAQEVEAANIRAAGRSAAAWKLTGAAILASAKASATARVLAVGAGLAVAGSLAEQSGNDTLQRAGGLASAVGTGAVLGSFIPLPVVGTVGGAIVGGTAFGTLELLNQAKKSSKENQAKLAAAWQAMTPAEQREFIAEQFPNLAEDSQGRPITFETDVEEMLARTGVKEVHRNTGRLASQTIGGETTSAREFVKSVGGLNQEDKKALDAVRALRAQRRQTRAEILDDAISSPFETFLGSEQEKAQAFLGGIHRFFPTANLVQAAVGGLTQKELEVNATVAQLAGTQDEQTAALVALNAANQRTINQLLSQLDPGNAFAAMIKGKGVSLDKVFAELNKVIPKAQQTQQALIQLLNTDPLSLVLSGIDAAATPGLGDDVTQAQKEAANARKKLEEARAGGLKGDDLRPFIVGAREARAKIQTAQQAVTTKAQSDADKAKADAQAAADAQIDALRFAADKAGNVGKAEDALLAALKAQVDKAKENTPEYTRAQIAYQTEIDKHIAAVAGMANARKGLRDARVDFALEIAKSTPGTDDEIKILRQKITNDRQDILDIQDQIKSEHLAGQKLIDAQVKILAERREIFGFQQEIKGVTGSAGGLSIGSIFQSAIENFREFGGGREIGSDTPLSAQDVRGVLAQNLIRNAPQAQLDKLLARFHQDSTQQATSQLDETRITNDLLRRGFRLGARAGTGQIRYGIGGARAVNNENEFIPGNLNSWRGN